MKFGTGKCVLNKKLRSEFRENRRCECHTVLRGVSKMLALFSTFFARFGWNLVRVMFAEVYEKSVLWKTLFTYRRSKWIVVLVICHICCQIRVRSVCESYIQSSWALFEFRENHYREGPAFSTDVNGTHVRVCAVEKRYSDSNARLGDVCSVSRREQSRSLVKFSS